MPARILVIEDNDANRELMTYLLRAFGHAVLTAKDGQEGLECARRELPDLIISDVQMPHVDGYQVARMVREEPQKLVAEIEACLAESKPDAFGPFGLGPAGATGA